MPTDPEVFMAVQEYRRLMRDTFDDETMIRKVLEAAERERTAVAEMRRAALSTYKGSSDE